MIQKDFKFGLVVGAICLLGLLLWLATNKDLSPDARMAKSFEKSQNRAALTVTGGDQPPERPLFPANETGPSTDSNTAIVTTKEEPIARKTPVFVPIGPNLNAPEDPATEPTGPKIKTNRFHIVKKGETLSEISQALYGTAKLWPKILKANSDRLTAPEKIQPGMYLIIPD